MRALRAFSRPKLKIRMAEPPYRSRELVGELVRAIRDAAKRLPLGLTPIKIMHVCGTHEHEISRYALRRYLPENLKLVAGPGCPVCITPAATIATSMKLAMEESRPILCAYGDIVRVPISTGSLLKTKSRGADVRIIYGPLDAARIAKENPGREVIFFSVGFETTAAPVASILLGDLPENLIIYCCHRYVPTAVESLAALDQNDVTGYLLPGHASVITGYTSYNFLPARFGAPAAVAGFEPVDILAGVLSIVRQVRDRRAVVANCYPRAVRAEGNIRAQETLKQVFDLKDSGWRGIGELPRTGLILRDEFQKRNALVHFGIEEEQAEDIMPGCSCHLIMLGRREPSECPLFGKSCTPEDPRGPCMVGLEGTCRAHYLYRENEDV